MDNFDDDNKIIDENAKKEIEKLERFDKLSDEEKQKELNLYAEERRQESIQKYGKDIYSEDSKKADHQKAINFRNKVDKAFDFYAFWRDAILVIGALIIGGIILAKVWGVS